MGLFGVIWVGIWVGEIYSILRSTVALLSSGGYLCIFGRILAQNCTWQKGNRPKPPVRPEMCSCLSSRVFLG